MSLMAKFITFVQITKKVPVLLLPQSTTPKFFWACLKSDCHLKQSLDKPVRICSSEIKLQSATKLFSIPFTHAQSNCSKYSPNCFLNVLN